MGGTLIATRSRSQVQQVPIIQTGTKLACDELALSHNLGEMLVSICKKSKGEKQAIEKVGQDFLFPVAVDGSWQLFV